MLIMVQMTEKKSKFVILQIKYGFNSTVVEVSIGLYINDYNVLTVFIIISSAVCLYVCVYICMHVCIYICLYVSFLFVCVFV